MNSNHRNLEQSIKRHSRSPSPIKSGSGQAAPWPRMRWEDPAEGLEFAAYGSLERLSLSGEMRLPEAAVKIAAVTQREPSLGRDEALLPLWVGGFGYGAEARGDPLWEGWPGLDFWIPRVILIAHRERPGEVHELLHWADEAPDEATIAACHGAWAETLPALDAAPESIADESPSHWCQRVERAAAACRERDSSLDKVVLARALDLPAPSWPRAASVPESSVRFAIERGPEDRFFGCSPERLVELRGRKVLSLALAGTAPLHRAQELLVSAKDRHEQAIVVEQIVQDLGPLCEELEMPGEPTIRLLKSLAHLETRLRGRLRPGLGLLDLAAALHPTPALCGRPRSLARAWLEDCEGGLERGWYGGCVGWLDGQGGGRLQVAIRSARVLGDRTRLYAGAGIVARSEPAAELAETELKLASIRANLRSPAPQPAGGKRD